MKSLLWTASDLVTITRWSACVLVRPVLFAIGGVTLPLRLGAVVGVTDFVGWALLPRPARGAGSYARYTVVGKLARAGDDGTLDGCSHFTAAGLTISPSAQRPGVSWPRCCAGRGA